MAIWRDINWRSGLLGIFSITGVLAHVIFCSENHVLAQITPDGTLGDDSSKVTSNVNIKGLQADRIDGGATRGANLFHSFQDFNVGELQRVYFANPTGIENILTRVTGSNISKILGTLGVDGGANLFFLNPNGILFGNNARLDVAGSFVASTANSFVFGDGLEFSTTNPQAPPLLKINLTPGLQYGQNDLSRTIQNTGNLAAGQDLKLFAGNLDLHGQLQAGRDLNLQGNTVKVRDSLTNPFIATAGGKLLVQGHESVDIFALNHPNSGLFARRDIVLRSANTVGGDAHFWSGGSFRIEKLDGSLGNLFSPYDPIIRSFSDVSFNNYFGTSLHILAGGSVKIGTAIITNPEIGAVGTDFIEENVKLSNGTEIAINGSRQPTLDIRAGMDSAHIGSPEISGFNLLRDTFFPKLTIASSATSADIKIGEINIFSPNALVFITNTYKPNFFLTGGDINITGDGLFKKGIVVSSLGGRGNGGSVLLDSRNNITLTNSTVNTFSNSSNGGDITLLANGNITLTNSPILSFSTSGKGGDVSLLANANIITDSNITATGSLGGDIKLTSRGSISFTNGVILTSSFKGDNGSVIFDSQGSISFNESSISSLTGNDIRIMSRGDVFLNKSSILTTNDGELTINAQNLEMLGKSQILVQLVPGLDLTNIQPGKITLNATGTINIGDSGRIRNNVLKNAIGNGGDININTGSLLVTNNSQLSTTTNGKGNAGIVKIDARDTVLFDGSNAFSEVASGAVGDSGGLDITTKELRVTNGSQLSATTRGQGNAGIVKINARETVLFDGVRSDGVPSGADSRVSGGGVGDSGGIDITTGSLKVTNGARLSSSSFSLGNAGSVKINARDIVSFEGGNAFSQVSTQAVGDSSGIDIITKELRLTNGAFLSTTTLGTGFAGNVTINAFDTVFLDGSQVETVVYKNAIGKGGNINITTNSLVLSNAVLEAETRGQGNAGNITIDVSDTVFLDKSEVETQVEENAIGKGGNINITTDSLSIGNGSQLRASTQGEGQAGSITVTANTLEVIKGGQLRTTTSSNFDAGSITLKVRDNISLLGSETGLFANTTEGSGGKGGSIFIDPRTMTIQDGAKIAVDSQGKGVGGNIELGAGFLTLDNGSISAETRNNTGGNITLILQDLLLLRNGSQISTTAGNREFDGDGGNITINTPFIVAVSKENSDIKADAYTGKGGKVDIKTNSIFGIAVQESQTKFSDITADSELGVSGEVTINTLDTDPARGLIQLPSNLVDASQQITQDCTPGGRQTASRFIATGRGGLPLSPNEPLRGRAVITDWVDLPPQVTHRVTDKLSTASVTKSTHKIVEAQGWIVDANGDVILVAQSPQSSSIPSAMSCSQ